MRTPTVALLLAMAILPISAALAQVTSQPTTSATTLPTTQPATQSALGAAIPAEPLTILTRRVTEHGVTVVTLSNQLTVIVRENHTSPVVSVQTYVRAGSLYEGQWLGSGVSHLLEHLVAKGAAHEGAIEKENGKEKADRLNAIGAQSNASTSMDQTTYYIDCVASHAGEAMDILADWMARPDITKADFQREHGVVQRELEMGKDNASRQMNYAHMANFYGPHPGAVPVIGYLDALRKVTYEDVLAYHQQRYAPQNMVLVVVGDVSADQMVERARHAFAGFEPTVSPAQVLPEVPQLAGVRRVVLTQASVKDMVAEDISFRSVPLIHPDLYALDVLSYVLANGPSSRLERIVLREKKLIAGISSSSWTPDWGAGQFMVSFRATPAKIEAAEKEILAQLQRVAAEGITPDELDKAKRQKVADFVYGQQSVESQASTLASDYLSANDVEFSRLYTQRIQSVTAQQVQQAARKYLQPDAMAITRMVGPTPAEQAAATGPASKPAGEKTVRIQLPNGLTVILSPTEAVDLVAMDVAVLGGTLVETDATNGLGTLMTKLSIKGAGNRSADDIAEFFDRAGGAIGAECGNNSFIWSATTLKDDAPKAMEILADVVIRPTYAQGELEIIRDPLIAAIQRIDEDWHSQLNLYFRRQFYTNSPYHLLPLGSIPVVKSADVKAIAEHHKRWVKAGSAVLTVYGNFDLPAMQSAIEKLFADMPADKNELQLPAPRVVKPAGEEYVQKAENEVGAVMIGWPGMKITEQADCTAMTVLDTIISGYQLPSGWLHKELRGKQLVYEVHAMNWPGLAPGAFLVYAATQPEKVPEVVAIIRKNIQKTLTYQFSQAEIDDAVGTILTAELLDNQTMASLAQQAALDELYGFGYDYRKRLEERLRAVTPADLTRVAKKYLAGPAVETVLTPNPKNGQLVN